MAHKITEVNSAGNTVVYEWQPQPDISAYELALCQPVFSTRIDSGSKGHGIDQLPDAAKRHWVQVS